MDVRPRTSRSMCFMPDVLIEMKEKQHGQDLLCYRGLRFCLQKNDLGWSGNPTTNPETSEYFSDCEGISVQSTRLDSALHATLSESTLSFLLTRLQLLLFGHASVIADCHRSLRSLEQAPSGRFFDSYSNSCLGALQPQP